MSVIASVMTTEEFLALPEDGIERDLIRGQVRERPMTRRSLGHSLALARFTQLLANWVCDQPEPRGKIVAGEAAFRIQRNPDTTVGVDVAYISSDLAARAPRKTFLLDGVPTLAVEILSPSDTHEGVIEKIQHYLDAGTALVWIADPDLRTVTVHRSGQEPEFFNAKQEIANEPMLPGLRLSVASLFDF